CARGLQSVQFPPDVW
nr:immunoglobulin heavy chain junction region [Macaca mulatta]MOY29070.1 immunoglobulin heavy chain junction region [Macaca mulatta]